MIVRVNGVERSQEDPAGGSLGSLIRQLRETYTCDTSLVASIRVDGQELSEKEEAALALLPLSDVASIEVFTAHPRELADETLQNLLEFSSHLKTLSLDIGTRFASGSHPSRELARLVDGIETFTQALAGVKKILQGSRLRPVKMLEADLTSILRDLLDAYSRGNHAFVAELLTEHLPRNLDDWKGLGLPSLARSRDS